MEAIREWPVPWTGLLDFVQSAWRHDYGRIWVPKEGFLNLATGGWSANEAIASALRDNRAFWAVYWDSSHRGGLDVLRMPKG